MFLLQSTISLASLAFLTFIRYGNTLPTNITTTNSTNNLNSQADFFLKCTELISLLPNEPYDQPLPARFYAIDIDDDSDSGDEGDSDPYALPKQGSNPRCTVVVVLPYRREEYSSWRDIKAELSNLNRLSYRNHNQGSLATARSFTGSRNSILLYVHYFPPVVDTGVVALVERSGEGKDPSLAS